MQIKWETVKVLCGCFTDCNSIYFNWMDDGRTHGIAGLRHMQPHKKMIPWLWLLLLLSLTLLLQGWS